MSGSRPAATLFASLERAGARGRPVGADDRAHRVALGAAKRWGVVARDEEGSLQVVFSSPDRAFACAAALLRRLEEHNRACEDPLAKVVLRQAVHRGPVELTEDGVAGEPARVLPRLLAVTPAGRVLTTRQACGDSFAEPSCEFIPLGWEYFEGLREPLDLFEVVPAPGFVQEAARGR